MELTVETSQTPDAAQEVGLHIHLPPQYVAESLGKMAVPDAQEARRVLSEQGRAVHEAALIRTLETSQAIDIPSSAVWPGIVGQETVATMALRRRQTGRGLARHPTDNTRHLI